MGLEHVESMRCSRDHLLRHRADVAFSREHNACGPSVLLHRQHLLVSANLEYSGRKQVFGYVLKILFKLFTESDYRRNLMFLTIYTD